MVLGQPALSQSAAATDSINSSYEQLLAINERILKIGADLRQVYRALDSRDRDRMTIDDLQNVARATMLYLLHAEDVIFLYQNMSSAKDRETVRKHVRASLKALVGSLEGEIKNTNDWIEVTKRPEILNKATELKNTIRHSVDVLNAVPVQ